MNLDEFYELLPAIYRVRDAHEGYPLRALLAVILEQINVVEEDLAQLYDDQFIETAADWVVPYIGDLIGYQALSGVVSQIRTPRAEVANTIRNRRRKGTAVLLEDLAQQVTGWKAAAVEFFRLLGTTQHMNHIRLDNPMSPDLRDADQLRYINTPFDRAAHTVEVRRIQPERGKYNIPNVGIFIWQLDAYTITDGQAFEVADGCYMFHPFGINMPLFNNLPPAPDVEERLAQPLDVPEPLHRRPLYAELENRRASLALGVPTSDVLAAAGYFGAAPVLAVRPAWGMNPVESDKILICDLSDPTPANWRPDPTKDYPDADGNPVSRFIRVAVDPQLGRLAFATDETPDDVFVTYAYGFSAETGGGPYAREEVVRGIDEELPATILDVSRGGSIQTTIDSLAGGSGVVRITDSTTYDGDLTINVNAGERVWLTAASGSRPAIGGGISVTLGQSAQVVLDGLLIRDGVTVTGSGTFMLVHSTIPPWQALDADGVPQPTAAPTLIWTGADSVGTLVIDHAVCGRVVCEGVIDALITDSILDALDDDAVALAATEDGVEPIDALRMARTSVIGMVHARTAELVENSIFTGLLTLVIGQQGCVRYSYFPEGSVTPRAYMCQPATALADDPTARVAPYFTSRRWNDPGYMQLHRRTSTAILEGADDSSEMGAFHDLYRPQRFANLRTRLNEYLRFGLEAGVFTVS